MRHLADPQPADTALLLQRLDHGAEEGQVAPGVRLQLDLGELVQDAGNGAPDLGPGLVQSAETRLECGVAALSMSKCWSVKTHL